MARKATVTTKKPKFTPETLEEAARKRSQTRTVGRYLAALESRQSRNGHGRAERAHERLAALEEEIPAATGIDRLTLLQEREDLQDRVASSNGVDDFEALEADFIEAVGEYAERKGISYAVFRQAGVPAAVLRSAGIARTRVN